MSPLSPNPDFGKITGEVGVDMAVVTQATHEWSHVQATIAPKIAQDITALARKNGRNPGDVFLDALRAGLFGLHAWLNVSPPSSSHIEGTPRMLEEKYTGDACVHLREIAGDMVAATMWWAPIDLAGMVYESLIGKKSHLGQFFTGGHIALFMAAMMEVQNNTLKQVVENVVAALRHPDNVTGQALLIAGLVVPPEKKAWFFHSRLVPAAAPFVSPVVLGDIAAGSARLLIAHARILPYWLHTWGLVRYYATDIDPQATLTARFNERANGLNGWSLAMMEAGFRMKDRAMRRFMLDIGSLQADPPQPGQRPDTVFRKTVLRQLALFENAHSIS